MAVALVAGSSAFAQFDNIGLLGGSTVTGWDSDTDMVTTDGITYTLENVVITVPGNDPGVKFRKDDAWTVNWGGNGFPSGTATQNGPNIPATNGTYNVTFNKNSGAYNFELVSGTTFATVDIYGMGMALSMNTSDGVIYTLNNAELGFGDYQFQVNGTTYYGSSSFPSGTATEGGLIPVETNAYNVTFNNDTKVYTFNFVTISLIGLGVVAEDPGWVTDVDLVTSDGVMYTLENYSFPGGEGKFRLNHAWATSWGSADFPSGTATTDNAPNLVITTGTYDVTFDRVTGEFAFSTPTQGLEDFASAKIAVFPNPTSNVWNFEGAVIIEKAELLDVTGKVVYSTSLNSTSALINAEVFAPGMYFARLYAGASVQVVKVVKK